MPPRGAIRTLENLVKWAHRPEWEECQLEVHDAFLDPAGEILGLGEREMLDIFGREDSKLLLMFVFEEFFATRFGRDGEINAVDDYLKRRGRREPACGRRFVEALRDSRVSLYEVIGPDPGGTVMLEDLLRGGRVPVHSEEDPEAGPRWDRLAARIVCVNGEHYFTGAVLPFPHEPSHRAIALLEEEIRDRRRTMLGELRKQHGRSAKLPSVPRDALVDSLPVARKLGTFWLGDGVLETLDTPPELRDADHGDRLRGEDRPLPHEDAEAADGVARAKLDSHYRRVLDTPLPFLGGRTPREASRGKGKVRQGRSTGSSWWKTPRASFSGSRDSNLMTPAGSGRN